MSDLILVQTTVKTVLLTEPRITGEDLFKKLSGQLSAGINDLAKFRMALSGWFKDGSMVGYKTLKGRYGGIVKDDGSVAEKVVKAPVKPVIAAGKPIVVPAVKPVASVAQPVVSSVKPVETKLETPKVQPKKVVIELSANYKMIAATKSNWTIQKTCGKEWQTKNYLPFFLSIVQGMKVKVQEKAA